MGVPSMIIGPIILNQIHTGMFHKFWHFLPQKILFITYSAVLVTTVSMELWPPHSPDLNHAVICVAHYR